MLNSIELFSGAGGLALGMSLAGFDHKAVIEWDRWSCDTLRENQRRGFPLVQRWPIHETDVREFDFESISDVDVLAGGPPCQPFSLGGKHRGFKDDRDMFPPTVQIVKKLAPKAFIIENVRGLTRASFANYFQYIILQLSFPEITRKPEEDWLDHLKRLEREKTTGHKSGLTYEVVYRVLNAADYGVPQKRERVFIVGFRHDLEIEWCFPEKTHSFDSLLVDQWVTGSYWEKHGIAKRKRPAFPKNFERKIEKLRKSNDRPDLHHLPWKTVRDAIGDMPNPKASDKRNVYINHNYQAGAKVYPGHTGSPLDLPAKTLKAGDHGVPGGENMMVREDGSVRYFTVRESARLQTFPDGYVFLGSWTETMRQLGNAVPVKLAQTIASSVAQCLLEQKFHQMLQKGGNVLGHA